MFWCLLVGACGRCRRLPLPHRPSPFFLRVCSRTILHKVAPKRSHHAPNKRGSLQAKTTVPTSAHPTRAAHQQTVAAAAGGGRVPPQPPSSHGRGLRAAGEGGGGWVPVQAGGGEARGGGASSQRRQHVWPYAPRRQQAAETPAAAATAVDVRSRNDCSGRGRNAGLGGTGSGRPPRRS